MHAHRIIQDLLSKECPSIHAKRRESLAAIVEAGRKGGLGLLKMSRHLNCSTSLRHRIKRCDRLLGNPHLDDERRTVYRALLSRILTSTGYVAVLIDWSDLTPDCRVQWLRASIVVKGRAITAYEETHPAVHYNTPAVHRAFLIALKTVMPPGVTPVVITDAGFRSRWFAVANELGFEWIGRIRNNDMVRHENSTEWRGCKSWYACATGRARNLGHFEYIRSNPTACRLVTIKKPPRGRKKLTKKGAPSRSAQSLKQRAGQVEPWLLAVSPGLNKLSAKTVVALYGGRMQIEQAFRDVKSARFGLGLTHSQTRDVKRLANLVMIASLIAYSLWIIGLAVRKTGYRVCYGSRLKAPTTLSIVSLARLWLDERPQPNLSKSQLQEGLRELAGLVAWVKK